MKEKFSYTIKKTDCQYLLAKTLDFKMGYIGIGMLIGFILGYLFPRIF